MKRTIKTVTIFCICCVIWQTSPCAQAQNEGMSLTLQQAEEYALSHNRDVANASIDVKKAEASKWKAITSMLPQVNVASDYSNYCGYSMNLGEQKIAMPPFISTGLTTSVAFSGTQIMAAIIGDISTKMSDISLLQSRQQTANQTKTLYCTALIAQESINILNESLESMKELYKMSQKSVDVGISEQTDADQLLVQVTTMENNITSARRNYEIVLNSMRVLLNIDAHTPITLTDTMESILNLDSVNSVLEDDFDIERNYSYQLLKISTDMAKKQITMAGFTNGPTISAYHQYTSKQYLSSDKTFNMTPPNMIGISLKIPIFTSGSLTNTIREARFSYHQQLNTLAQTESSLRIQHSQLVYNLRTAVDNFLAQSQNVDVAQRVFDNFAKKYEFGYSSSMDVTNAHTSLLTAESNYIQAMLDIMQAQISLEELMNK